MRNARRLRGLRRMSLFALAALAALAIGAALLSLNAPRGIESVSRPVAVPPPAPPKAPSPETPSLETASQETDSPEVGSPGESAPVAMADLEDRLQQIASEHAGFYGVAVFDPASGKTATLNADETFVAASIGKLPALIALYRFAARGQVDLEDSVSIQQSDYQTGTGILQLQPVGYTVTLRRCAYLMINESDNTGWEMLHRYLGRDNIEAETYAIGARSTGYWIPNTTTLNDVLLMLRKISDPSFTTEEMSSEMLDAMTNTVNEDRIPQPLPSDVRVAHKFGSYGDSFGDAGIVFYKAPDGGDKRYYLVVLSEGASEYEARATMREMSLATYKAFTEPGDQSTQR
ncbi:MAG: class A beta-lactamase-related serine hydrolase [Actinomycetota bacterium]|nr:class A beta-lactamase-related serine hydrolase [Actinomycetota bacterium]